MAPASYVPSSTDSVKDTIERDEGREETHGRSVSSLNYLVRLVAIESTLCVKIARRRTRVVSTAAAAGEAGAEGDAAVYCVFAACW